MTRLIFIFRISRSQHYSIITNGKIIALFAATGDGDTQLVLIVRCELPPFADVGPTRKVNDSAIIDFVAAGGHVVGYDARPTDVPETLVILLGLSEKH